MVFIPNTQEDFNEIIKQSNSKLILINFYADWCEPCKNVDPVLETLQNTYSNIIVLKVNVERFQDIALEYRIKTIPTFCLVKKEKVISRFSGVNLKTLRMTVKKFIL